jgi:hypothetical protein
MSELGSVFTRADETENGTLERPDESVILNEIGPLVRFVRRAI